MTGYTCTTCGEYHDELPMCFGPIAPELWFQIQEAERAARTELSSDQCVIDEKYFFMLGRILIPVHDAPEPFVWLAWVSLSETNFLRACELWDEAGRENEPPYFAWLQSALPYEPTTLSLKTMLHTQAVGERPLIELEETDHPLAIAQRSGITLAQVQQIAEAHQH
ncbi:DUF2199 domain-containing protein [Andreprevotia chitinilytica]|uniref:DUF2199 domain-containing protein n=1 Tax=Andreprevotia chitinilytica TaxID=396808 RepID=UPI00055931F1|nr:DUF2199 domain-containing protein [Andreprevotia chitinilytica]